MPMSEQKISNVAIINDTTPTNHYGCLMVMSNLRQLLHQEGVEVSWTWPVGKDWRKHKQVVLGFEKVDAIIVNGEGTIHHGPRRWQAQALVDFADFAHQELQVPVYLINATLFANEDALNQKLKEFDAIYVRDRASHEELNNIGIENSFVPDMTFALSSGLQHKHEKPLCVVDSVMQTDVPILKKFSKSYNADYCSMIVARPSNYSPWKKTRRFVLETWKWFFKERHRSLDPKEFEKYLGQYQLVVTGRYHTVTMCLKNRVPFIALESNTPKISFLLKEVFGDTSRVIAIEELANLDLAKLRHFSETEQQRMDKFLAKAIEDNQNMIRTITALRP